MLFREIVKTILFVMLVACSGTSEGVDIIEPQHFEIILYDGLSVEETNEVAGNLENNYNRILEDLRVQNMPDVTVKIWSDYNHFLNDMENDIGTRYTGATGYIFSMTEMRIYYNNDVATAAVHEFAHLVSMQVNPTISNNPRWLWEAVALYENNEFVNPKTLSYMVAGNYPTLTELNVDYNNSNHSIYSVGYVLCEFIVEKWGMNSVIKLIETNGNVIEVLGINSRQFESEWYHFIETKYLK